MLVVCACVNVCGAGEIRPGISICGFDLVKGQAAADIARNSSSSVETELARARARVCVCVCACLFLKLCIVQLRY